MHRYLLLIALTCGALSCKIDNPVAVSGGAREYLPLSEGNTWVYDMTTKNESGRDTTIQSTVSLGASFLENGTRWFDVSGVCFRLPTMSPLPTMNPLPTICAQWAREGNAILARRIGEGPERFTDETILEFPLFIGKKWTITSRDTTYLDGTDTVHIVEHVTRTIAGIDPVRVPAGTYPAAIHVVDSTSYSYRRSPVAVNYVFTHRGVAHEWYVSNVGMVRQTTDDTYDDVLAYESTTERELREFNVKPGD